jgi:hypothetical protein
MSHNNAIPLQQIDPNEQKKNGELAYGELVNSFLALANEHWQTIEIESVGAALREATARFNAYEASTKSIDLAGDRENAIYWFSQEFRELLTKNIDQIIEKPAE